ncbi:transcriptional repressor [Synechococcus sp. CBW1002]|jgi:Fur family ferric uptake transcriptional regulator|uniref:Fur family transcriptional regulator n=1 Tax=Synechococcus sp. CBW1002 TaxID=1353134 RepID=UPI0018CE1D5F|nr:transcriptional repressor [Synechococcus sp. CBW1002]QPN59802.1 transcriptional repressor [Synechococcus sp. CBW1002]
MGPPPTTDRLPPRQQGLLKELGRADAELSGQELHARLRGGPQAMGLATVYRHLRQLQQRGLVRCRHLPTGEALFAPTERDEHHLTCVDCGTSLVLHHCPVHGLALPDGDLAGFQPLFHTLEFFGLCRDCRQRQETEADQKLKEVFTRPPN